MAANLTNASEHVYEWEKTGGLCQLKGSTGIALYITMLILLAIITSIANLLIIIVICKNDIFRRPSFYLLGILAVIDFLTGKEITF